MTITDAIKDEGDGMTNLDYIRTCDRTELAYLLCKLTSPDGVVNCGNCVASEYCGNGKNGFVEWLRKERESE